MYITYFFISKYDQNLTIIIFFISLYSLNQGACFPYFGQEPNIFVTNILCLYVNLNST